MRPNRVKAAAVVDLAAEAAVADAAATAIAADVGAATAGNYSSNIGRARLVRGIAAGRGIASSRRLFVTRGRQHRYRNRLWQMFVVFFDTMAASVRKITVHVKKDLLRRAQRASKAGVSDTVRKALEILAAQDAYEHLLSLEGKLKLSID